MALFVNITFSDIDNYCSNLAARLKRFGPELRIQNSLDEGISYYT